MRSIPSSARVALAILASLGLLLALWFGYAQRAANEYAATRATIDSNDSKALEYQNYLSNIQATGRDYLGELFTRVQSVDTLLPTRVDRGEVASTYPASAEVFGLSVQKFSPIDATKDYQPFTVEVEGTYPAITAWLSSLESSPQLITVGAMALNPAEAEGAEPTVVSDQFTAVVELRFWTEEELPLRPKTAGGESPSTTAVG